VQEDIEFMQCDLNLCEMMLKCKNVGAVEITLKRYQKNRKGRCKCCWDNMRVS
jgi:hypothetical protein